MAKHTPRHTSTNPNRAINKNAPCAATTKTCWKSKHAGSAPTADCGTCEVSNHDIKRKGFPLHRRSHNQPIKRRELLCHKGFGTGHSIHPGGFMMKCDCCNQERNTHRIYFRSQPDEWIDLCEACSDTKK